MSTEEKIILAALRQFELHGFSAATTKAIAAEAGVAEVTLFRYFGDKRTMFIRVAAYVAKEFQVMEIPDMATGDFHGDMRRLCAHLLRHFIQYNALFRMLIFEAKKHEDIREVLMDVRGRALRNILALVNGYVHLDAARSMDLMEWLANSLLGASVCCSLFYEQQDEDAFVTRHAGIIADAFIQTITTARK